MRGKHAGGFAFYVSADACEKAKGTMKIKGFCTELTYARKEINVELQGSNCDEISIQVINAQNYARDGNIEVTDASIIVAGI